VTVPAGIAVGVLALQGDHAAHVTALRAAAEQEGLDVDVREVRTPRDLEGLAGLVVPGGESTTLLKLLAPDDLGLAIGRFVREQGGRAFGTCAGAILLSREVTSPAQASLGLLDAAIERNAYGRQIDSFVAQLRPEPGSGLGDASLEAVFIRAPRFAALGADVEVLARGPGGEPVLVRQGPVLAATFHPELTRDLRVHALFLRSLTT
jgi:5'-phosphate synthase pdxT subunit